MSAVWALSWEMVARFRWWFAAGVAYLAVACLVIALLPEHRRHPGLGVSLAVPLIMLVILVHMAQGEGGDLRSMASCYPRRLYTLPVSSFVLATVPLALPLAATAAVWLAAVFGLLRPCGADAPVLTPGLAVTAGLSWIQALAWSPFPVRWLRAALVVVAVWGLFFMPVVLAEVQVPLNVLSCALAAALALSYPVALLGVSRGRRGVGVSEPARDDPVVSRSGTVDLTPYPSPFRAQLRLELRALGWVALTLLALHLFVMLPVVHLFEIVWGTRPFMLEALGGDAVRWGSAWVALQPLLLLPIAFTFIGADLSPHLTSRKGDVPPFFATRPVDAPTIVLAKMLGKAFILAVLWTELVVVGLAWAAFGGHLGDMTARLGDIAGSPSAGAALIAAGLLAAALVNWLFMIGGVWVGLTGRQWVYAIVAAVCCGAMVLSGLVVKGWQEHWYTWLAALILAGLASKVVTTAWVCRRLTAWRYATAGQLAAVLAAWLVVVGTLAAVAARVFPGGWLTAAAVLLLVPLAQTLAAPLALAWNRHR